MSNLYRGPSIDASYQVLVGSFGQAVSEEKIFRKRPIKKQELPVAAMFVNEWGRNEQSLYRGPSKDAPYQVSIPLAKRFQRRRFFRNQPIRNKNGLWHPCLLTDWDEMSNLYRGHAIDASYQVLVHLAKLLLPLIGHPPCYSYIQSIRGHHYMQIRQIRHDRSNK